MNDDANCIVCGSSQHGNWECKPEQAPREQKIQWFERAWVVINLPAIAVLSRGLSHGLVTEIERLRERAKQNIDAKYEIGRMLGCPEHEELLPWIVRYRDEHERLRARIEELEEKQRTIDVIDHIGLSKAHIITTEQIDKAWGLAHTADIHTKSREMAFAMLKKFGIERCEVPTCNGGRVLADRVTDPATDHKTMTDVTCDCHACNGKGWVKR